MCQDFTRPCFHCATPLTREELLWWAESGLPADFLPCATHREEARAASKERAQERGKIQHAEFLAGMDADEAREYDGRYSAPCA